MAQAIVDSEIRLHASTLPSGVLPQLHRALSFKHMRFNPKRAAEFIPEEINLLDVDPQGNLSLPRGAIQVLRTLFEAAGAPLTFADRRVRHPRLNLQSTFTLRDYQAQAAAALVRHTQGLAILPCGAGKTVIGTAAIERARQPALILVHTRDLLEQWRDTIRAAFGAEPGVISGGDVHLEPVTIAMVQTLARRSKCELAQLGARFGAVLIDECHHVPATTFRKVLSAFPAFFRFGLTATPERSDGLTPMLPLTLGEPVFQMAHAQLVEAGHLVVPEIVSFQTGLTVEADGYTQLLSALVSNERRNQIITRLAAEASFGRHALLILSARVEHCERLAQMLCEDGLSAAALTGRTPKEQRGAILEAFRQGELAILCATSLADEGLDISRLERLILATPARAEGRTIQRLGRLMRPHPGKRTPVLYDLVDEHPTARSQHAARQRAIRSLESEGLRFTWHTQSAA